MKAINWITDRLRPQTTQDPRWLQRIWGMAQRALHKREALYKQLSERLTQRSRLDNARWRQALQAAEHPERPNRRPLLAAYQEAMQDAHLVSIVNTRKLRVLGAPWVVYDGLGQVDAAATALLQAPWLQALVGHIMDSIFYGHSLIELHETTSGLQATLIPRAHVLPERGLLTLDNQTPHPNPADDAGWLPIAELPHALLQVGQPRQLGLLAQAVPLVLMKRNALACWSEFIEVFGMPLRIGRTPARDEVRKRQLADVLHAMGSAAYAVLDEGDQIEFAEHGKGDAFQVYDRMVERVNLELSKLINGQTLTTEPGDRGARALGQIHDAVYDDITQGDLRMVQDVLNAQLLPLLSRFTLYRHLSQGYRVQYRSEAATLSLAEQWAVDSGLLQHFDIDPGYFAQKYQVPITARR